MATFRHDHPVMSSGKRHIVSPTNPRTMSPNGRRTDPVSDQDEPARSSWFSSEATVHSTTFKVMRNPENVGPGFEQCRSGMSRLHDNYRGQRLLHNLFTQSVGDREQNFDDTSPASWMPRPPSRSLPGLNGQRSKLVFKANSRALGNGINPLPILILSLHRCDRSQRRHYTTA